MNLDRIKKLAGLKESSLDEGVYDPHIFKAVFMAGGPGSGKSFVAKKLLGGTGLKTVNSDDVYEYLLSREGLTADPETIASPHGQEIRKRAKKLTDKRKGGYLDGRLGLIIDGTGKDVEKIRKTKQELNELGYDTMMLFVNTSEEVAQERNLQRERSLKRDMVSKMWKQVQENIMKFQQVFGAADFHVIDNSGGLEDPDRRENFDRVHKEIKKFIDSKPTKPAAKAWIAQELKRR